LTITIPAQDVVVGTDLRMRIVGHEGGLVNSCTSNVGSFKDITVRIKAGTCVGSGFIRTFYLDNDGDGFGDPMISQTGSCAALSNYVADNTDFDDSDNTRYPNATELCDNKDNDGDNEVDEDADYDSESTAFTNETIPSQTYTARTIIETAQSVNVLNNTAVHLIAGQTITLKAGFSVAAGATFHAQIIEDCGAALLNNEIAAIARTSNTPTLNEALTMTVYPNPFRSQATVDFYLPQAANVSLQVYGMNGQLVKEIISAPYEAGAASITFTPEQVRSGFYYFVLKTGIDILTEKVVMIGE